MGKNSGKRVYRDNTKKIRKKRKRQKTIRKEQKKRSNDKKKKINLRREIMRQEPKECRVEQNKQKRNKTTNREETL